MKKALAAFALLLIVVGACDKLRGPKGDKGDKGDPGTSCSVTQNSNSATIRCTDGTVATVQGQACTSARVSSGVEITCGGDTYTVQDGAPGIQGPAGPQGLQGVPGSAGTVVSFVQFCPQYNLSYPTSFPEFGLCVGGDIFGVYWDSSRGDAFGAKLPQGTYRTTNTQLPCDFTIGPNCTVQ